MRTTAHKATFKLSLEALKSDTDPEVALIMGKLAEFPEIAFSEHFKPFPHIHSKYTGGLAEVNTVRWAIMNVNSIYHRETALCDVMLKEGIALLAMQETFMRPSRPTKGLFSSIHGDPYVKYGAHGRRGLMTLVHPEWAHRIKEAQLPSGDNPNILWVTVEGGPKRWFVANVYFPNDAKEAKEVILALLADLEAIPEGTLVIVMGDMNGDPFQRKGTNRSVLPLLFSSPLLVLIPRPNTESFTCFRTTAKGQSRSHIDNFVVSPAVAAASAGGLEVH